MYNLVARALRTKTNKMCSDLRIRRIRTRVQKKKKRSRRFFSNIIKKKPSVFYGLSVPQLDETLKFILYVFRSMSKISYICSFYTRILTFTTTHMRERTERTPHDAPEFLPKSRFLFVHFAQWKRFGFFIINYMCAFYSGLFVNNFSTIDDGLASIINLARRPLFVHPNIFSVQFPLDLRVRAKKISRISGRYILMHKRYRFCTITRRILPTPTKCYANLGFIVIS